MAGKEKQNQSLCISFFRSWGSQPASGQRGSWYSCLKQGIFTMRPRSGSCAGKRPTMMHRQRCAGGGWRNGNALHFVVFGGLFQIPSYKMLMNWKSVLLLTLCCKVLVLLLLLLLLLGRCLYCYSSSSFCLLHLRFSLLHHDMMMTGNCSRRVFRASSAAALHAVVVVVVVVCPRGDIDGMLNSSSGGAAAADGEV